MNIDTGFSSDACHYHRRLSERESRIEMLSKSSGKRTRKNLPFTSLHCLVLDQSIKKASSMARTKLDAAMVAVLLSET